MDNKHQKTGRPRYEKRRVKLAKLSTRDELNVASYKLDILPGSETIMEEVCEKQNLIQALKKVKENKGAPGVDGMTVDELGPFGWDTMEFVKQSQCYVNWRAGCTEE